MKCIICHGEEIEMKEVREELPHGEDIVYVSVKIPVCLNCGERYYDRRTMLNLEEIAEKLSSGDLKLKEVGKLMVKA